MGLPSGIMWAPCNVDARNANGFAESAYVTYASYVSWGNVETHEPDANGRLTYDFGSANGGPYASTPGAGIVYPATMAIENDVAHAICGGSWRMPSSVEFAELLENSVFIDEFGNEISEEQPDKRINMNGVTGIRLKSTINSGIIFLVCGGHADDMRVASANFGCYCWSSELDNNNYAKALVVTNSIENPAYSYARFHGLQIRPVWDNSLQPT